MNWLKNLKITNKILFSLSIGILSCVTLSSWGLYSVNRTNNLISILYNRDLITLNKVHKILSDFYKMDKTLGEKVIAPTKETIRKYDIKLQEDLNLFEKDLVESKELFYLEKEKLMYESFYDKWTNYKLELQVIRDRAETVDPALIEKLKEDYDNKFNPKTRDLIKDIENIIAFKDQLILKNYEESQKNYYESILITVLINILVLSFFILLGIYTGKIIKKPIETLKDHLDKVSEGDFSIKIDYQYKDEILDVSKSLNAMIDSLKKSKEASDIQNWLKDGLNQLSNILADEKDLDSLSNKAVSFVARYLEAGMGALYLFDNITKKSVLSGSYAFNVRDNASNEYELKEGIVGQVAYEKQAIIIKNIQRKEKDITTALISEPPVSIFTTPLLYENNLCGVMELSTLDYFSPLKQDFLIQANKIIGTMINSLQQNTKVQNLLLLTQEAQEEAESRANEAIEANENLELQKRQLEEQSEKMRQANAKMEEQQLVLEQQSEEMRKANSKMETQHVVLEKQAEEMREANAKMEEQQLILEQQAEEMRHANAKMEEQQLVLEQQAEEMRQSNAKMEEQQLALEQQKEELNQTNKKLIDQQEDLKEEQVRMNQLNTELIEVQDELNKKADQLEQSSKYKSEFLANMSHELRTPLNSVILLSQLLAKNKKKNLEIPEVEKLNVINKAGKDLLNLINDILDLSKIEAGKLNIELRDFPVHILLEDQEHYFTSIAAEKEVSLVIENDFSESLMIRSDSHRIAQILRNFMSNAFKFTKNGSVTLKLSKSDKKNLPLRFSVIDTGIGVSKDKQDQVFEAFSQADGSTTRLYGGTGLGLSISVNLAKLLGGEITLESQIGVGSNFSLFLPYSTEQTLKKTDAIDNYLSESNDFDNTKKNTKTKLKKEEKYLSKISDDRNSLKIGDNVVLIVEDDINFANSVAFTAKEMGLKSLIALTCNDGIEMAKKYRPSGIMLDLGLPDKSGMELLRELKATNEFKDIPIHIVSGDDSQVQKAKTSGAVGFQMKPALEDDLIKILKTMTTLNQKNNKRLLIVEDNKVYKENIMEIFSNQGVIVDGAETEEEAKNKIDKNQYDSIIIDLYLENGSGYSICKYINEKNIKTPIIVHTGKDLSENEEIELKKVADSIILKTVNSYERLIDEVSMFFNISKDKKAEETKDKYLSNLTDSKSLQDLDLENKKILVVDDDIKNIFVLTSALEETNAEIFTGKNGKEGIDILNKNPDIDLVIMDIMMPVMNGYEAIEEIRANPKFKDTPIIAATAKAMKDDREKCINAGASDYITKPIDLNLLMAMLEKWIKI